MSRAGVILMAVGLLTGGLAWAQFEAAFWVTGDPTLNPVGNGILFGLGLWVASGVTFAGVVVAVMGRAARSRP